jgi:DNA-binding CsgD family transcriptional regulator
MAIFVQHITNKKTTSMKLILAFLLTTIGIASYGQDIKQDTVIEKLNGMTDKEKINYLSSNINSIIFIYPKKAMDYLDYYEKIPIVQQDSMKICYVLHGRGLCYEMMGDYSQALDYIFKSLRLAETIKDSIRIAYSLAEIGFIYENQSGQYEISLEYQKKALEIYKKLKNYHEISGAYNNIGNSYRILNQLDSAVYYHKKSIKTSLEHIDKSQNAISTLAITYTSIGDDYQKLGYDDSVLFYKDQARVILEENNMQSILSDLYYGYAYYYRQKGDPEMTQLYLLKSLDIALNIGLKKNQIACYNGLSLVYEDQNNYKKAYESMVKRSILIDSLNQAETRTKLAELQAQYDYELNKHKIEKLELDGKVKDLHFIILVYTVISIIVIAIIILISLLLKRKKDKLLAKEKDKKHESERLLAKAEKEKAEILNQELKLQLEFKNKELTTHALNMMQKNKLLQELTQRIDAFRKTASDEQKNELRKVKREINRFLRSDKDWDLFKLYFEKVNDNFFEKMKAINPELSINDLRLGALIKLNMNIKESASVLNVAPNSVKSARYRLRKKLNLDIDDSLYNFIQAV